MDAAFHERDTHVTAKCNVCFKGVNAAGGATETQHAAIGGIANARRRRQKALRGRKGASARGGSGERQSREARGRRQRPNRMASTRRQAANGRQRLTEPGDWQRTAGDEHAQRRRAPSNRPLRPNEGAVAENGAMGPFCRVNYSRKGEWLTARNTFCLMGGNIDFIAKSRPTKNRPHSRHFWHRNTIPGSVRLSV